MKKNLLLLAMVIVAFTTTMAQNLAPYRTFVISGGDYYNFDDYVSVGYINHFENSNTYHVFDEIYTQSTQSALIDENTLFVCAQDSLVSYDLTTLTRKASVALSALNRMAVYKDKLLVTRQFPETTETFAILDKSTLIVEKTIQLSAEAAGIQVVFDSCYVALPGPWGAEEGKLAVIDMSTETLSREINLGADARGVKEVFHKNGTIYTVNTHFCDDTENTFSVTKLNTYSGAFETNIVSGDFYAYTGNSFLAGDKLYIPLSQGICSYDLNTGETVNKVINGTYATMHYDYVEEKIHTTTSAYNTNGTFQMYNLDGSMAGSGIEVGIAPDAITLEYQITEAFSFDDVVCWVGEGDKKAMLVVDWNDDVTPTSLAWGYRFSEETATGEEMLQAIAEADSYFTANMASGFLNDLLYNSSEFSHSGLAGNPSYWSTWSRTPYTSWFTNMGISSQLNDGDRFGCSYGFDPSSTAPDTPVAATDEGLISTNNLEKLNAKVYSIENQIIVSSENTINKVTIFNTSGQEVLEENVNANHKSIATNNISKGIYFVKLTANKTSVTRKVVIR